MMELIISSEGEVRCLYGEEIDLASLGSLQISRASHVEPDHQGQWWADMGPVGGPRLGPFDKRSEAIGAEREWIQVQLINHIDSATSTSERQGTLADHLTFTVAR